MRVLAVLTTLLSLFVPPASAQQAMPPAVREALGLPAPAIDDIPGWDVTRWGMTAEQLTAALGPRLMATRNQIGLLNYPGRGLTEVRFGTDFVNRVRDAEAAAIEAALRAAYGEPTAVQANEDRTEGAQRERIRALAWNFPSTTITFRHALVMGGADGIQDLLTVSFQRPR
jgi:hypothetical protein